MQNFYRGCALLLCAGALLVGCTRFTRSTTFPTLAPTGASAATSQPDSTDPTPAPGADRPVSDMTWTLVANAEKRGAVCNDGSPAGYYIRRGVGAGSTVWNIHLQGGGMCYDLASCGQRAESLSSLMSASEGPELRESNGIQSISSKDNPDFYNANHVYVHYCSSDLWSGQREASAETGGRHFQGLNIFRAVIQDLMDGSITAAPNLAEAKFVLFSGSSAGGAGVLVHLDWLAAQLPTANVRGVDDAGWFLDSEPFESSLPSPRAALNAGYRFWNGAVDESCAAQNVGGEGTCLLGPQVYPFITTPLFIQIAQFDGPQLGMLGLRPPLDEADKAYAIDFAERVRASLEPVSAAFSPARKTHGILIDPDFWKLRVQKLAFREVLANWLFDRSGPTKLVAPFSGDIP